MTAVPSGPLTAAGLADHVRDQVRCAAAEGIGWRSVVEGLRPHTASLWQRLDPCERRRFLAVHAREWEVRRHRMAPQIAQLLDGWRAEGRLCVLAGTLTSLEDLGGRCLVGLPTGPVDVDAVVNCTGPLTDVTQSRDPLIASLLARGLLRPDPLRLGIDCTPCGEVVGRGGEVVPGLFVVGPPRKGTLYETTAVPEIRGQAAALAERLG